MLRLQVDLNTSTFFGFLYATSRSRAEHTIGDMGQLTISEVAGRVGLRASAIRYYEQVGILAPARRVSGQRRYDGAVVQRLAVMRRAQEVGFTLEEIRELFGGSGKGTPVSTQWKNIARRKLVELDAQIERIRTMKGLLQNLQTQCVCETIEQCGAGILAHGFHSSLARRKS